MAIQTFALTPGRINKFKGEILRHAVPLEVLGRAGRQVKMPKNSSDTYVARSFLPYNSTVSQPNQFFANGTGDRTGAIVTNNMVAEGVTSNVESITPRDVTVVLQQYGCLYGFTDKTYDLYEDDIPQAMIAQVGERVTFINELIVYGTLKAGTNQFYGGTGTSRSTVNGGLTLGLVRKITKSLQANHGKPVTSVLGASQNVATEAVAAGYLVYCHTDFEPDIRDLVGFIPAEKYATGTPMPNEIGKCERFRFITSPEFVSFQDAGAAVASTGLYSTTGANIDIYPFIVTAADAWSQIAIRGKEALDPTFLRPGEKSKSDPQGQRGYAGTIWWKAVMIENNGWMAVGNCGLKALV
jgi:N4-gp56 family major capsid protein